MKSSRLYWLGNIAKGRVINDILNRLEPSEAAIVFDYGCGDGGDWPSILAENPNLRLVGYEPLKSSYQKAVSRLRGKKAELLTGKQLEAFSTKADFIVSFSVFEHVVERSAFLFHAKRILAADGAFYLNYDDGHFRNLLDVAQPVTYMPALRAFVRTIVSPVLASLGVQSHYQRRVTACEVEQLVKQAGFSIQSIEYHNLLCLKALFKTLPSHLHQKYAEWWLRAEERLNAEFRAYLSYDTYGDDVNLWQQMVSRTLCLKHS